MNQKLVDRLRDCPNLPSLPSIAIQVIELAQRPDVVIGEIAQLISCDPALSGRILRTVNSSFYARSQQIGTVSHAVTILGLQSVKTLVLGFSLVSNLSAKKGKGFKHLTYWKRCVYAATAARVLSKRLGVAQHEELFIATLLSDIGMLVLDRVLGEEYGVLCAQHAGHSALVAAEINKYGMTHAEVGGMMAESWKLPAVLHVPIRRHHDPENVADPAIRKLTELVNIAGRCADVFIDFNAAPAIAEVRETLLARHRLGGVDCDLMLAEIGKKTREVAALFEVNVASPENFETILKRANEALVDLTLRTQQQAGMVERKANTDFLTGLANRGAFDVSFQERFAAARAGGTPLSLLMLDVDKFKEINDRHGHPAGDAVLKALGKLLQSSAKVGELAARYGGEEMAMVLPVTRQAAAATAEAIRTAVAARPINCGNNVSIPISVSIGVATIEPGTPFKDSAHLLKAADLALYAAKGAGRNCVRIFKVSEAFRSPDSLAAPLATSETASRSAAVA